MAGARISGVGIDGHLVPYVVYGGPYWNRTNNLLIKSQVLNLVEALEDLDDVQNVYSNMLFDEADLAAIEKEG